MQEVLSFMWDYGAFPIWWQDDELPLPDGLETTLQAWSDEATENYMAVSPQTHCRKVGCLIG